MSDNLPFRDRVAMSTQPPSLADLRDLMGLPRDTPLQPTPAMPQAESMAIVPAIKSVLEHYEAKTVAEKFALVWKFRYISADAALAAQTA